MLAAVRLAALSVDLDEIDNYHHIHGLAEPPRASRHLVYERALPRLLELAEQMGMPLTLFAIGRDVRRAENAGALRAAHALGHEIGNHSQDHLYALSRLPREAMRAQLRQAQDAIEAAVGVRPLGFRAPGYTVNDALLDLVAEEGFAYDSSVFPCPSYYAAKASAMLAIRLAGRRSKSVLDTPQVLRAPRRPYRLGRPYWRHGAGLWELPIQVTPGPRLPLIGTSLTLAGPPLAAWLTRACVGEPLINLELHGIDLLELDDGLGALRAHQPDVQIALSRKLSTLQRVVTVLREADYRFVTLAQAARAFNGAA